MLLYNKLKLTKKNIKLTKIFKNYHIALGSITFG